LLQLEKQRVHQGISSFKDPTDELRRKLREVLSITVVPAEFAAMRIEGPIVIDDLQRQRDMNSLLGHVGGIVLRAEEWSQQIDAAFVNAKLGVAFFFVR